MLRGVFIMKNVKINPGTYGKELSKVSYEIKENKIIFELTFNKDIGEYEKEAFKNCLRSVVKKEKNMECEIKEKGIILN